MLPKHSNTKIHNHITNMLIDQVRAFMAQHRLPDAPEPVLVGLSGGVDSVVLTEVLRALGYVVQAVHVNYQLRGAGAEADEDFVVAFCEERGIPLHVFRFETQTLAHQRKQSVQAVARELRYERFEAVAEQEGLRWVAVGHHLDDQAETVLLHLFRGTGVEGLAGMPVTRPIRRGSAVSVMRPLLGVRRSELEAYARAHRLTWREDPSNTQTAYRRGAVRSDLLPCIEVHFGPDVSVRVAQAADRVRAYVDDEFEGLLAFVFEACLHPQSEVPTVRTADLERLPPVWRGRVLLEALARYLPEAPRAATQAQALDALIQAQVGRRHDVPGGAVWRERDGLAFVPEQEVPAAYRVRVQAPGDTVFPAGCLRVKCLDERPASLKPDAATIIYLDASWLAMPLVVRPWSDGDRMQPFGMAQTKKVSDLLTDAKVPAYRRASVPVLTVGEEVLWVVGVRMAEPARVTPETERVANITFLPAWNSDPSGK